MKEVTHFKCQPGSQIGWATGLSLPTILKKMGNSTLAHLTRIYAQRLLPRTQLTGEERRRFFLLGEGEKCEGE